MEHADQLPTSGVGNSATRLVQLGNSRGRYWREGVKVGDHALLAGVGAAGYGTAVTRYTDNDGSSRTPTATSSRRSPTSACSGSR